MKLFQALLLNVVTVVVALVVYDQLRDDASGPQRERASTPRTNVADKAALEGRLRRLEARESDAAFAERLDALEAAVRGRAAPADLASPEKAPAEWPAAKNEPRAPAPAVDDAPTKAEVSRFRKLQEAVRRENAVEKNRARVDGALTKLSINLTPKQREAVHQAYAAFEPQVARIWTEVKMEARETSAAGGVVDRATIVASTTKRIQTEFAATLGSIFGHPADAEAVSEALMPARGK